MSRYRSALYAGRITLSLGIAFPRSFRLFPRIIPESRRDCKSVSAADAQLALQRGENALLLPLGDVGVNVHRDGDAAVTHNALDRAQVRLVLAEAGAEGVAQDVGAEAGGGQHRGAG